MQLYEWFNPSVRPSVCPSVRHTFCTMFSSSYHHKIFWSYYHRNKWCPCKRSRSAAKGQGGRVQFFALFRVFPGHNYSFNLQMAMKWCTKLEVVQHRCPIVFQDHPSNIKVIWGQKIADFDPVWVFPDCNSSLSSLMAVKWCTKLEVAQKRCPIVFQDHTWQKNRRIWPKLDVSGL